MASSEEINSVSLIEDCDDLEQTLSMNYTKSIDYSCSNDSNAVADEGVSSSIAGIGNPTLEEDYSKFQRESKFVRKELQKWVVVAQSTGYLTNVLTVLVPRLMVPPTWEDQLDASDVYGIPTLDGFICDLKCKVIRKRTKSDMFTKTFNVNRPGSNLDCYQQMRTFFLELLL